MILLMIWWMVIFGKEYICGSFLKQEVEVGGIVVCRVAVYLLPRAFIWWFNGFANLGSRHNLIPFKKTVS